MMPVDSAEQNRVERCFEIAHSVATRVWSVDRGAGEILRMVHEAEAAAASRISDGLLKAIAEAA